MKGYEYYSIEEFEQALLSDEDNLLYKCMATGKSLVHKYSLQMESVDLFHEAICRVLADSRHIPKDIPLVVTVGKAMKSIAYDTFKRKDEEIIRLSESIEIYQDIIPASQIAYEPDLENAWEQLLINFTDDEEVLAFLKATSEGDKKSDIVNSIFAGDMNRYDTTRRRIIRSRNKLKQEIQ